jgi:hypothetical protein
MANFIYNEAKRLMADGAFDWDTDSFYVRLVMTNTTADTEDDKNTWAGFTTPDEYNGSGYPSGGQAIAAAVINEDAANDRAELDGTDTTFTSLGAGTRQCQAAVIVKYVDGAGGDIPIAYIDTGGFPWTGNGGNVTLQWNAEGILQVT